MILSNLIPKQIHPLWIVCIILRSSIAATPLIYDYLKEKSFIKILSKITKYIILIIEII